MGPSQSLNQAESHGCCCLQRSSVFFSPYPQRSCPHLTFQALSQRFHFAWHSLLTNHEISQPTENQRLVLPHFIFSSCPKKMYLSINTLKKQIRGKSLALLQKPPVFLKTKDQPVIMYLRKTQKTRTCEKSDLYPLVSQINGVQQLRKLHTMISRRFLVQHLTGPQ